MKCLNCGQSFVLKVESKAEADHYERSGACCPACCQEADDWFASHPDLEDEDL